MDWSEWRPDFSPDRWGSHKFSCACYIRDICKQAYNRQELFYIILNAYRCTGEESGFGCVNNRTSQKHGWRTWKYFGLLVLLRMVILSLERWFLLKIIMQKSNFHLHLYLATIFFCCTNKSVLPYCIIWHFLSMKH